MVPIYFFLVPNTKNNGFMKIKKDISIKFKGTRMIKTDTSTKKKFFKMHKKNYIKKIISKKIIKKFQKNLGDKII